VAVDGSGQVFLGGSTDHFRPAPQTSFSLWAFSTAGALARGYPWESAVPGACRIHDLASDGSGGIVFVGTYSAGSLIWGSVSSSPDDAPRLHARITELLTVDRARVAFSDGALFVLAHDPTPVEGEVENTLFRIDASSEDVVASHPFAEGEQPGELQVDPVGNLLVGGLQDGLPALWRFDALLRSPEVIAVPDPGLQGVLSAAGMAVAADGRVWLGSQLQGADPGGVLHEISPLNEVSGPHGLTPLRRLTSLLLDPAGILWVAGQEGADLVLWKIE